MIGLDLQQLTIRTKQKIICESLSISMKAGEMWGILGPNGSGKTTLLHSLAGLHPTQAGHIFLNQQLLTNLSKKTIAQSIGILFQDYSPAFTQTVWDYCLSARFPHLHYYQRESTQDQLITSQALQQMDLHPLKHRPIHELSGGEKRRLAIAALLTQTPAIYLLDEPTNHLDLYYQTKTLAHFYSLAHQGHATIVMALHDINLAQQFCDYIILLFQDGECLFGPKEAVLTPTNLSRLFGCTISSHVIDKLTYWIPQKARTP